MPIPERFREAPPEGRGARSLAIKMALSGRQQSQLYFWDDRRPWCDSPVRVVMQNDPRNIGASVECAIWAPCRKCEKCLQFRRLQWLERIEFEVARAPRTWNVNFTFDPIMLAGVMAMAAKSKYWPHRQDTAIDQAAYWHVQLWLKRMRKRKLPFRFFACYEKGEEFGRPHYHMLLHETVRPITWRSITDHWPARIKYAKLLPEPGSDRQRELRYITKYLTQDLGLRPRASQDYGFEPKSSQSVPSPPKAPPHTPDISSPFFLPASQEEEEKRPSF